MGGQALKNCVTRRYEADEYDVLTHEVASILIAKGVTCTRIPSYFSKESHGDLDMLVKSETLPANWDKKIVEWFEPKELVKNGNVISFEYQEFQIDLISVPEEDWLSSFLYYSFNDASNLIGRVAHSLGLKLGYDGLSYNFTEDTWHFRNVILLKDYKDILPVLGYSYERYQQGFDTLEDIFKFVVSSPFFRKSIYALENRNNAARTRDKKRRTYMEFLKWLENYEETKEQRFYNGVHQEDALPYLMREIPSFRNIYDETMSDWADAKEFKKRYNGSLVTEWTGLKEKELGEFMKWNKDFAGVDKLKHTVLKLNAEVVKDWTIHFHDKWAEIHGKQRVKPAVYGNPNYGR